MTTMSDRDWKDIKYFKPYEFNEPDKMEYHFINRLDQFREMVGKPIIVHSSYREDSDTHKQGIAVDIHIVDMNVLDMFLLAEKSDLFKGIGVYPNWNSPGLHIDMRNKEARWGCWTPTGTGKKNIYVPLDSAFIKRLVEEKLR